ncbi:MAG: Ig-like domain-containing protein [Anaerolineae bacterium]
MSKNALSQPRPLSLILALLVALTLYGCGLGHQPQPTPIPPPSPTATDSPTVTPVPPRPVLPFTPMPPDTLSPIIVQRSPKRGQSLAPDAAVELVFDKAMDQETVAAAFRLEQSGTGDPVQGSLTWNDDRTMAFKPSAPLPRETTYDVILTQDAVGAGGEPLNQPFTFRFTTAGELKVAQVIPAPDTQDVETDATITVIFNRPVVPLTTLAEMTNLPDPLTFEPSVEGSGEWLNTSIYVFTPEAPLAGGVTYRARIAAGLEDISGAALTEDFMWTFTTAPPKITWVSPREGATLIDINTPISVQFNQPVDPQSAQAAFSLRSGGVLGGEVRGSFEVQTNTLVFTPTRALNFDTQYRVTVDAGVTSVVGGEGMAEPYNWNFTTVPLPRIVSTSPEDGDRDAPSRTDFRIVFNAPIDPTTVMPNLSMTPPMSPTQVHTYYSAYNQTFVVHFGAEPSTNYQVTIDDGIADPYGNTIPQGRVVRFRTAELPPTYQLRVPDFAATYDAALRPQVVVAHLNLTRLRLRLFRLPISGLTESRWAWQDEDQMPGRDALIREWEQRLESPQNTQQNTVIDLLESEQGRLDPGVYLLDIDAPEIDGDRYWRTQRHMLVVSDLNLTLKSGPEELMIWATDLATGNPVPNLALTVLEYGKEVQGTITTDREGVAQLGLARDHRSLLVYSEIPFAAISADWGRGIRPWDFGVSEGASAQTTRAYIYTDRPIYRPGQTVHFKGVVRDEEDATYALPDLGAVEVTIRDIMGEELYRERVRLSDLAAFEGEVTLPDSANLGEYVISASFGDQYQQGFFTVAAYRPPEFEVTVEAAQKEIQRGDPAEATITLSYFFGGPLKDTAVSWNVLSERYTFEPPWGGTYTFSDIDDPYRCYDCWWYMEPPSQEPVLSGEGRTDSNGQLSITLGGDELSTALEKGARRLILEATAVGPDNQQISGRTDVVVHPGPYYVGLRPRTYVGRAERENEIDLVVVDWEGNRLPAQSIKVSFYRREWINTFVESETGGGRWTWETKETLVDESVVSTDHLGEAVASFTPPEGGSYHVVAEPAAPDARTANIRSSIFVWVSGGDYVSWRRENHDRITLVSDKSTYDVGDTAEILIPSPFEPPHMALVTVEREGIRRYDVLQLNSNSAIYRLPIEKDDIPNIYVSVVLIKPRGSEVAEFKMGVLPLSVNLAPRTLSVSVEADKEQAQPGEEVTYTLTAVDPGSRPVPGAELSLDIVDKAVLSLMPRSVDILDGFYARRMLEVSTASGLSVSANRYLRELSEELDLGERAVEAQYAMGAEAEEAPMAAPMPTMAAMDEAAKGQRAAAPEGVSVRQEFADTAYWSPRLTTDQNGQATATITLPDNLTTWVARAVAFDAETNVGEGTADLVATKPVLIRPVAPRFFVVDDRAQLAANVTNNTSEDLDVAVTLSAAGIEIDPATPASQTVTIPANSETKVAWWVTVTDVPQAELIFSAQAGAYADASKPRLTTGPDGTLLVLRYTAPDTVGTAGQLTTGGTRTEAIALPPEFDDRRGQLTVQLDPSLAASMQEGLEYLEYYEYECTEQTVSRFLPNVLTYRALTSLGIEDPELSSRLPDLIEEGLSKLNKQQNPDGGWGWWHRLEEPKSNAYVSAYVVFSLLKSEEAGFSVDRGVLERGLNYLQAQVKGQSDYRNYRDANRQAWLLYVLAEGNAANAEQVDALYENRDRLSHYARAYLAQAIGLIRPGDARLATLLSDLNNAAILSATGAHWEESSHDWWAMNTDTRSTAIILDTLAKLDPANELIPNVVRWLMVAREFGVWETTQETAWALIALTDWMMETGELDADYDFALYLNDLEQVRGTADRSSVLESVKTNIPIQDLQADQTNALTIARTEGTGRLYYTAHLQVYLPVDKIDAEDRGFVVHRRYTLANCEAEDRRDCPEVREIKLGDVVRVDLTIITPHDRYYVVVEDPLPAGGEAVDTGLATTSLLAMDPYLRREDSRYWWWWHWYSRSEMRDEKVVLFADYLAAGTYEYSYTFRATLPGDFQVIPTTASEFYFPEVFGRSEGRLLTIGQ